MQSVDEVHLLSSGNDGFSETNVHRSTTGASSRRRIFAVDQNFERICEIKHNVVLTA